jgi:DNA-directed RNA polymerase subunit RPC12/RpoP
MVMSVFTWRCSGCGTRLKVLAETDPAKRRHTVEVACPDCSREEVVHAHKVLSILAEHEGAYTTGFVN